METKLTASRSLTLLLVRHGETDWNAQQRWQGQHDIPLNDTGQAQAAALGRRLSRVWERARNAGIAAQIPGPPAILVASDLERASETAAILRQAFAKDFGEIPLAVDPRLRERSFGSWEGLTHAEVVAKFGTLKRPTDGEAYTDVWARMRAALVELWESEHEIALAVGHGGSLRAWLSLAAGLGADDVRRFALGNTSLSVVEWTGESLDDADTRLWRVNDTAHLETDEIKELRS